MTIKQFAEKYRYQLILVLVSFVLYGNTLRNDYALDDEFVTGPGNLTAKGIKAIPRIFRSFHVQDESNNNYEYRPFVKVVFAIEHQFFGVKPKVSHFFNIVFYAISLLVFFRFLKVLLANYPPFTLFAIALIYACLPIHSEVVVSLKNRDVLLSFIFTFLAFTHVLRFQDDRKWYRLLIVFTSVTLAFLSKYDVLPFCLIAPICLYQRGGLNVRVVVSIVVVAFIGFAITKYMKNHLLNKEESKRIFQYFENPLYFPQEAWVKVSAALNSMGFYVKMLFWPTPMASYYGYNVIDIFSFTTGYALLGLAAFALCGYFFFIKFKTPDLTWYGILFFGGALSMYLNFVRAAPGIVADRFLFFATTGIAMIAVQLLLQNRKTKKYPADFKHLAAYQKGIPLLVFVIFAGLIIKRNGDWKNRLHLFEVDSKNYPESVKLSLLCASQTIMDLQKPDAIRENEKALKVQNSVRLLTNAIKTDSSCIGCYNNLGYLLLSYLQDYQRAKVYLREAYRRDSSKRELVCNLGISYLRTGRADSAKYYLLKTIELDTAKTFMVPYEALQALYVNTDPNAGIEFFQKKIKENPNSEAFHILLAKTYYERRDTLNCIKYYKEALKINPNNTSISEFLTRLEVIVNKKYF